MEFPHKVVRYSPQDSLLSMTDFRENRLSTAWISSTATFPVSTARAFTIPSRKRIQSSTGAICTTRVSTARVSTARISSSRSPTTRISTSASYLYSESGRLQPEPGISASRISSSASTLWCSATNALWVSPDRPNAPESGLWPQYNLFRRCYSAC